MALEQDELEGRPRSEPGCPAAPFKANAKSRHHIPKQRRRLRNWPVYEASLRQRGDLTVWFTDDAVAAWRAEPRTSRGGQALYSPLAILTALTLRAVFRLALHQTEGLIGSVIRLLGLDLPGAGPYHSVASGGWAGRAAPATLLHGPGAGCGRTGGTTHGKPIHLPGIFALPFKYHVENIAIGSPRPGIGSRIGRSMTRH
jgi:hypothetical protein